MNFKNLFKFKKEKKKEKKKDDDITPKLECYECEEETKNTYFIPIENKPDESKCKIVNNSKTDEYYCQINNKRCPTGSCFNTSMINASKCIPGIEYPETKVPEDLNYTQLEDKYDVYIHSKEITDWAKSFSSIQDMLNNGFDYREIWNVEEYAFNHWSGKDVCRLTNDLTVAKVLDILNQKGVIVMSGKFCGFNHVVSIVGYISNESNNAEDWDFIIDDPYGNPFENYQGACKSRPGEWITGNDIKYNIKDFWEATKKSYGKHFGIVFSYLEK